MIPNDIVERIIDAARIEEVVGDFVTLKRSGANYQACCPFHNEKTPSFSVSPSKGIYKCFGCGKAGTAVGFVMEHESMSYVEALKYLAKKYNIEVVEEGESAEMLARKQHKESLMLVSEYAAKFFKESLLTQEGQTVAYQYFRSRGLTDETIARYGLGWGPSARTALADKARSEGYKEEFLTETGVCIKYDGGRLVDRFSDRVIFPIYSVAGRVIGFGGRTLRTDKSVAKYQNSPTSEIYDKRHTLYGINFAKSEISRRDKCILVEGYLDVLSMHQLGITNVVASSGTSLTVEQIRLIRKFTNNVTIIYDGDPAGIKAALRGIGLVLKEGLNVKVILLPEGQDPDDFARSHTLEQVEEYIKDNEQDFISFKTDMLLGEAGNDPIRRAELIKDISETIALIPDAIVRAVYVRTCADKFEIAEHILTESVSRSRTRILVEDRKRQEREGLPEPVHDMPPVEPDSPASPVQPSVEPAPQTTGLLMEVPQLAPCEKEILGFVLEHGCDELKFDRDSKYYIEGEGVTVAEFIDGTFAEDDTQFVNTAYRKVYDEFFRMYDEGLEMEKISSRLLNNMDPVIAEVARDILIEKYQITVANYVSSLTSLVTRLVQFVPRSLLVYHIKKIELELDALTKQMMTAQEDQYEEILLRISDCNKKRNRLNNELGRV
ncbi:MAG: DNA primase [Bacteroidales bacterium]|nr:DNA primase [Bacteroidales bacterium]